MIQKLKHEHIRATMEAFWHTSLLNYLYVSVGVIFEYVTRRKKMRYSGKIFAHGFWYLTSLAPLMLRSKPHQDEPSWGEQAIFKTQPGSNVTRGLYLDKHVHDNFRKCLSFLLYLPVVGCFSVQSLEMVRLGQVY